MNSISTRSGKTYETLLPTTSSKKRSKISQNVDKTMINHITSNTNRISINNLKLDSKTNEAQPTLPRITQSKEKIATTTGKFKVNYRDLSLERAESSYCIRRLRSISTDLLTVSPCLAFIPFMVWSWGFTSLSPFIISAIPFFVTMATSTIIDGIASFKGNRIESKALEQIKNIPRESVINFLKSGQHLSTKCIELGTQLGEGAYGTVHQAVAIFADEAIDLVTKEFRELDNTGTKNEFFIFYLLLKYIKKHFKDFQKYPDLKKCINHIPLLALTDEQDWHLSGSTNFKDLWQRIDNMITESKSTRIHIEQKPGSSLENFSNYANRRFLKEFSPEDRFKLFQDLLEASALLGHIGISHRDIRSANVNITKNDNGIAEASLLDFGISIYHADGAYTDKSMIDDLKSLKNCFCASPESYSDCMFEPELDNSFGCGMTALEMFFGKYGQEVNYDYFMNFKKYSEHLASKGNKSAEDLKNFQKQKSDPHGSNLYEAQIWARKQYFKDIEANVRDCNEQLKKDGLPAFSDEQCDKIINLMKSLLAFNPKDRSTCARVLKEQYGETLNLPKNTKIFA